MRAPDFLQSTQASYDAIAEAYAAEHPDSLAGRPLERALLTTFVELVRAAGTAGPPVADVGSGPGYVTARLHEAGLPVFGVDTSPRMVALARRAHPELRFHVGSMTALDLPEETLGGIVALYSIIHVPDDHLPSVFAGFRRVLLPGAPVLLGFQSGDEDGHQHLAERYGQEISLDYYWRTPDTVAEHLEAAGLELYARVLRAPQGEERMPRAFLLARRPTPDPSGAFRPTGGAQAEPPKPPRPARR
ncbi:SAM-dependent methyltransferase [Streptomyces sp. A244]|uniref:class I SAM-dependent DNA methyltransferase n=1 Tax=Streptomyces sp. A244 TaxID=2137016 RepID=UPI000D1BD547|nr:class I SAM-dependent methyltransferase [Streptomyces sp. A244]PTH87986.1 SAM-dependent methyltransferase [Streptomyces sp. A244]